MLTNKKLLSVIFIALFAISLGNQSINAYSTSITVSNAKVIIDISRVAFHTEFYNFAGNMTLAGNTVEVNSNPITDLNDTLGFFISQPESGYNQAEKEVIESFLKLGNRTLFVTGDSDYGGYFLPTYVNELLDFLNSSIRLGADSISDAVYNDGADFRVAATDYGNGLIADITKEDCTAGIMLHGPSTVLGYNGTDIIDLRTENLPNVEVLLSYSVNATCIDSDVSETIFDFYASDPTDGSYPAVICEKIFYNDKISYIVAAGEVIFSDYKYMYSQYTENHFYNEGIHYGQMFVDNIVSYLLGNATYVPSVSEYEQHAVITVLSSFVMLIAIFSLRRKRKFSH